MQYAYLFISGILGGIASISLKIASINSNKVSSLEFFTFNIAGTYLISIISYGLGFLFYGLALKKIELTLAYPVMVGITIISLFSYGYFIGNEVVSIYRVFGSILIFIGIFLIVRS